jgi:TP901 family phage tail tape measure protein
VAEQVFRIEIPIQAIDLTDKGALDKIDETLSKILKGVEKLKSSSASATDGLADGAKSAAAGLKEAGKAADDAGKQTDAFEKRVQKSNKTLRGMFKEKFQLIMQAIDRASPILKQIGASAKSLVSKAWRITVTLFDKVTAPFRSLYRMITSPISIALSIAGIGLGAKDTIGGFIDFQKGMSAVRALTGATNEEFKRLNQTAKDLGASTVFSASEVSQGMQYLGQSGWQVNEVISAMPGLLDMAAAGGADLATASDIVATVMRAMKIEAKDASRVADIFAKTATSSATNIEMMGETLKYAAPIAQGFGLSLEEVAALTGQMANAGIKGSMAGTAIRSSLLSMATPTKQAAKLMNDLNLSFSNSDGTMKGMSTIVRDLQTSFSTLTKEQRLNAAETLFGTYASSAWLGVIEQGADSYEAFQKSLEGSAGAAADMAKIRLDNLAGDIEELSGAFETLQFELMEKLNPYFRQFIQWFTGKMPMIQEKVLAFTDKAIEGIKRVSKHIGDVFASDDFKNADGFAAKFFVAWDKIIAEPMQKWWDGGGKTKVLAIVERIAKTAGEMLRGIATGIIAAFTGQEIDFEGLNITGMAKAGAEAAKTFVSTFFKSLDLGSIAKKIPSIIGALMRDAGGMLTGNASGTGLISTFLLGKGALTLGGSIFRGVKLFGGLKTALFGVSGAAKVAGAATTQVATAATAAGAAKSVGIFAGIKGALAAIPGWGWAAAAALTAVGIGLKLHSDAQERHRQELMTDSEKGAQAWKNYQKAATQAVEATNTIARIKEVKLKISRGGLTDQDIEDIKTMLVDLSTTDPTLEIVPKLKKAGLTEAEITELRTNLTTYGLTAEVEAKLKSYGLTDAEIVSLRTGLAAYNDLKVEVEAKLKSYGLSETDITGLKTNLKETEELKLEIGLELKKGTNWTQAQIDTYITDLTGVEGRMIQLDLLLQGASLGEGALAQVQADLDATKIKIAGVDTSTLEGLAEWQALKEKQVMLTLLLQGGNLTPEQVTKLSQEYAAISSKEAILKATLKQAGFSDEKINQIVQLSTMAGQKDLVFKLNIARGGLTDTDITNIKALLTDLTKADPTIDIIPKLKRAGLTEAEITELRTNLTTYGLTAEVEAKLKSYGLTDAEIASLRTGLAAYNDLKVEVEAKLKSYGLSETDITGLKTNLKNTSDLTLEISTTLKKGTNWTQAQIDTFITDITGAEGRKIQLDLLLQGASLGEGALAQVQKDLDATTIKIAGVDTSTLDGLTEWTALKEKEVMLTLLLQGGNLTPEQVTQLSREYVAIETKTAVLTAELKKQGYTDKDIQEIVTLSQMAGQNNLVFNVAVQGISADQLANYNKELETLYGHLVGPSGGVITQEDIEAGRVNEERVAQAEAAIQAKADTDLANLRTAVFEGQATVPEQEKMRARYQTDYDAAKAAQDTASIARANLASIQADVATWFAQDASQYARTQLDPSNKNYMSYDAYDAWSEASYINRDGALEKRIMDEVGQYTMINPIGILAAMGLGGEGAGAFDTVLQDLMKEEQRLQEITAERQRLLEQQNANLVGQYTNEKNLVAGETFQGSNLQGKSIEDAAAVFSSLDTTGTQLFMDALNKLNDLNAQTNYITPAEKTNPQQMAQIAESSMLVAEAKQRISTVQAATPFGTSEEDMKAQAQAVSDVNKALDAMNLDKISSYTQIGEALKSIEEVDISKVDTTALHSALETLGGVSSGTQAKIDALRDAVAQLDGKTATVTVTTNYQTNGEAPPQGQLPNNAMGGIYDGAFLSWVAEDGPEAIIPLSAKRRNRGLDLWLAAGRALGVGQFAEGGIVAPYAGLLSQIGDSEEAEGRASAYAPAPQKAGVTVSVSVNSNPVFQIESENPEGVMDKIRANIKEIVDMLGSQMAAELEDILSNMPA